MFAAKLRQRLPELSRTAAEGNEMPSESRRASAASRGDSPCITQLDREARYRSADCREAPTYLCFPELGSRATRWRLETNRRNSEGRCANPRVRTASGSDRIGRNFRIERDFLIRSLPLAVLTQKFIHLVFRTRNGATRCRSSHQPARQMPHSIRRKRNGSRLHSIFRC
jgi:hypothetical protein